MSWKITALAGAMAIATAATTGFAADTPTTNPGPQGQGMTGGSGDMSGMMNMMGQMTRMMDSCNRMMDSATQKPPAPATPPERKG